MARFLPLKATSERNNFKIRRTFPSIRPFFQIRCTPKRHSPRNLPSTARLRQASVPLKSPKKILFSQPPARDSKFRSGQSPARNLPPPGITSRKDSSPSGRNTVSEGAYTPSERPLNERWKTPLRSGQEGFTGNKKEVTQPCCVNLFFHLSVIPRLFNGLCRRGCMSRA